jgi:hypothetical protein
MGKFRSINAAEKKMMNFLLQKVRQFGRAAEKEGLWADMGAGSGFDWQG